MKEWKGLIAMFVFVVTAASTLAAQAGDTGIITGRITEARRGTPLPGALVRIEGTSLVVASDRTGAFRLVGVAPGKYKLLVSFLGREDAVLDVTVGVGQSVDVPVSLEDAGYKETVTVVGDSILEGAAKALNQQRTALNIRNVVSADQIGSFPDPNAAEAASRVPGVSITRDQGEGRYILIRGTEARLNTVMIDGERIPSPEDARQVMLDVIPADQLQSIEVSKAITPDMDADSIGGAVNLITKQAVGRTMALFSIGGGYNGLQRSGDQRIFSGTVGRRVAANRVGLLAGFSGSSLTRGSENFEAVYNTGALSDLQLRDYQIKRERYGLNFTADARTGNSQFALKTIFNKFKDYEVNNRIRFRPPNRRIEHVLKNRHQSDVTQAVSFSGAHALPNRAVVDYRLAWARSEEDQPDRLDTIFRQTNINFAPNVSAATVDPENIQPNPSANNPANARLNVWETEIFKATERDITGSVDLTMPLGGASSTRASFLKAGFKVKDKSKRNAFKTETGTPTSVVMFPTLQDTGFDNDRFLEFFPAGYEAFPGIDAEKSRAMFNALPASSVVKDPEGDAEAFTANETVGAGYAMLELYFGPNLVLVPGLRYESTRVDYTGNEVLFNADGDYESTRPITGKRNKGVALPGLHLRYSVNDQTNLRAAYSRTLARPNYYDLVPYQLVQQEDGQISRGNSALSPTVSDNLDLLVERYFQSVGIVSAGVFTKHLTDYIYAFTFKEQNFGELYDVIEPRNGDSASLWGVELAFQNQLRFLPAPFNGLGVYANYTWTGSSATFPGRTEDARLPGQSSHLGNFALSYEKAGFSGRASWNFHGRYIDVVGATAADDEYYDNHTQVDLSFSQRITRNVRAYADFLNLTNAPLRYYFGVTDRPRQEEYYRSWMSFGLRFSY